MSVRQRFSLRRQRQSATSAALVHGFKRPENINDRDYDNFVSNYLPILSHRSARWAEEGFTDAAAPPETWLEARKLKRFIRKGVPKELRPHTWLMCSGADANIHKHPDLFAQYVARSESQSIAVNAIQLDLDRTFPDNKFFQNARGTLNKHHLDMVLRAVAAKYTQVGYCQGLNLVAALMLLILESPDKSFWLLDSNLRYMRDYYRPDMAGLKMELFVLTELLRQKATDIHRTMARYDVDLLLVGSKWFICWFLDVLPIETVLRVWDCLIYEGPKILFRVSLTLMILNKQRIVNCANFIELTEVMKSLGTHPHALDAHQFMQDIFTKPGTLRTSDITALRQRYIDQHETSPRNTVRA